MLHVTDDGSHRNTCLQRLVVLGAGVHWCLKKGVALASDIFDSVCLTIRRNAYILTLLQSVQIAKTTLRIHIDQLYPNGHLRYAVEVGMPNCDRRAALIHPVFSPNFCT